MNDDSVIILVGCAAGKRAERSPARDLYDVSQLFRARRQYAEKAGYPWAVLSALHGLVMPDQLLEPYDFSIADLLRKGGRVDPQAWANSIVRESMRLVGIDGHVVIEVHAGIDYVRLLRQKAETFESWRVDIIHPVEGLGIGEQKAWYAGHRHLNLEHSA